ncbi:OB-fold nucleic acid binding domain-containing protein, partial [Hansschlegelia zhihuaiae]
GGGRGGARAGLSSILPDPHPASALRPSPPSPLKGEGDARPTSAFPSIEELRRRTRLPKAALIRLADADAFRSMGLDRRAALWEVRRLPDDVTLPLFQAADAAELGMETLAPLPEMPLSEQVVADYQTTRLSLKGHPMQFLRGLFSGEGVATCATVREARDGRRLRCAGVVLVRQKPGSAKGVVFMTVADETGVANAVVWPAIMKTFRKEVMGARLVLIEGRVQRSPEGIVHLVAERLVDRTPELGRLSERELKPPLSRADEVAHPQPERQIHIRRHPRNVRILPPSRDFH